MCVPLNTGAFQVFEPLTKVTCWPLNQNWYQPVLSRAMWIATTKVFHWRFGEAGVHTLRSLLPSADTTSNASLPSPTARTVSGPAPRAFGARHAPVPLPADVARRADPGRVEVDAAPAAALAARLGTAVVPRLVAERRAEAAGRVVRHRDRAR